MPTTHSAFDWLKARAVPGLDGEEPARPPVDQPASAPAPPPHTRPTSERHGRAEVERLHREIEDLVSDAEGTSPRTAVDSALGAVARLQVVSANLDANNPPKGGQLGRALIALADRQLQGHTDAIERGMTYTADNTMRLLTAGELPVE